MNRWLIILPLLLLLPALPVYAGDEETREKTLRELVERLQTAEREEQSEIVKELQKLLAESAENWFSGGIVLEVNKAGPGKESISGRWSDDGESGHYTLTSLGKSRYKLKANKTGQEGEATKIEDEGTLAELRKKYPFLKSFQFVTLGPAGGTGTFAMRTNPFASWPALKHAIALGVTLRRPSKDLEYHLKLPTETSWIVESVPPGSRGAKLGLKKLDLLTHADDEDLSDVESLKAAKKSLALVRRGKPMRVSLVVERKLVKEK